MYLGLGGDLIESPIRAPAVPREYGPLRIRAHVMRDAANAMMM
jgi:hypothetical protein